MTNAILYEPPAASADPDSAEAALLARIPLFDRPEKTSYLCYRGAGFNAFEAAKLAGATVGQIVAWQKNDPDFADFEKNRLRELQGLVGKDLLRLQFTRNMHLLMRMHYGILHKATFNWKQLTQSEFEMLKTLSRQYSPSDLQNMMKATSDSEEESRRYGELPAIHIHVEERRVIEETERRAAARQLLRDHIVSGDLIEGEARVIDTSTG